jgi:hypothetical protein
MLGRFGVMAQAAVLAAAEVAEKRRVSREHFPETGV